MGPNLSDEEIYRELRLRATRVEPFWGGETIHVQKEDFRKYQGYFVETRNIFNRLRNYRTPHKFRHLHAVEGAEQVGVHVDYGNPRGSLFGKVVHLFRDVIPYFVSHAVHLKKPYNVR